MIYVKNFVFNNYGIHPSKIYCLDENNLQFFYNDDMYYIYITNFGEISEDNVKIYNNLIEEINMKNTQIKIKEIIKTKNGEFLCKKNNKVIILFRKVAYDCTNDIKNFINDCEYLNALDLPSVDLKVQFEKEINDLEVIVADNYNDNLLVQKSFNYYVGMAENAVQLLYEYDNTKENYLGLKCNFFNSCNDNFNIFNFFKANKYYNIVINIKLKMFAREFAFSDVDDLILNSSENDLIYLFALFLYPIEFFDVLKILFVSCKASEIEKEKYNKILHKLINNMGDYLKFLNYFREKCINFKKIELINWII